MIERPSAEMLYVMENALRAMHRRTRAIFLAHRLDDLDYRQIADRLGIGIGIARVERHIARAIAAIDRALTVAERERQTRP